MHKAYTPCAYTLGLALAACAAPQPEETPTVAGRIVPAATGLEVAGTGLQVGFGRDYDGAVASVSKVEGAPVAMLPDACTVVRWDSGLEMHFTGRSFEGWLQGGATAGVICP